MPRFKVDFSLTGEIIVDCDDAADARRYVECTAPEQMLLWLLARRCGVPVGGIQVLGVRQAAGT